MFVHGMFPQGFHHERVDAVGPAPERGELAAPRGYGGELARAQAVGVKAAGEGFPAQSELFHDPFARKFFGTVLHGFGEQWRLVTVGRDLGRGGAGIDGQDSVHGFFRRGVGRSYREKRDASRSGSSLSLVCAAREVSTIGARPPTTRPALSAPHP